MRSGERGGLPCLVQTVGMNYVKRGDSVSYTFGNGMPVYWN